MKKRTVRKLEYLLHVLTAIILALKASLETARGLYFPAVILIIPALTVLVILLLAKT